MSIYSLESHTKILVFFLLQLYQKPQHLFMLEWIQLMFRGYIVYKLVIIKLWRIVSMVITLRVICPQNQGFLFFSFFRVAIHALEILDTPLLLNYTMIGYGV